ncbi:MAG TPA: hypothetical protein VID27_23125 [Blastocatellia bacterium]|jgi:hypothetical protein
MNPIRLAPINAQHARMDADLFLSYGRSGPSVGGENSLDQNEVKAFIIICEDQKIIARAIAKGSCYRSRTGDRDTCEFKEVDLKRFSASAISSILFMLRITLSAVSPILPGVWSMRAFVS